ncbi:unnamed protein product [Closterium sp. Yama58-4]|nr:unnamed protein product [Closterium sp. Yama58-4]
MAAKGSKVGMKLQAEIYVLTKEEGGRHTVLLRRLKNHSEVPSGDLRADQGGGRVALGSVCASPYAHCLSTPPPLCAHSHWCSSLLLLFVTLMLQAGDNIVLLMRGLKREDVQRGQAGDNVGLLTRGLKREDVQRGQVACKPGPIKTSQKFQAEIHVLTKEEGGRHLLPNKHFQPVCACLSTSPSLGSQAGDNVGLLMRGLKREDVQRGQVACKPGSIKTSQKFQAEIYVLTKEEGGRHTAFFSNYRPQCYLRTADVTGKVVLPDEVKMVMPGDNVTATFELLSPVAIEAGQRFALREGGRTVGAGVVAKLLD